MVRFPADVQVMIDAGELWRAKQRVEPAYSAAIERYVLQHGRGGWRTMLGTFPSAVRRMPAEEFPQPLRDDYAGLRVPKARAEPKGPALSNRPRWISTLGCLAIAAMGTVLVVEISEALHTVHHWVLSLFK